jgi:hypothetical protein
VAVVRRALLTAAAAGLVAATPAVAQTPAPAAPVTGNVIFDGSWDLAAQKTRGDLPAQWLGMQVKPGRTLCFSLRCARYALRVVAAPVRDGAKAARFTVKDGDNPFGDAERAEVQAKVNGRAGTNRWYTWSTYIPPSLRFGQANDNRWFAFTQWAVSRGAAPVQMTFHKGQIVLQVNEQANPKRFVAVHRPWGTPAAPHVGRWVDFAVFVRWANGSGGQIQLWVNGVQQQMNWPFGGSDPTRFGGVGAFAFTGKTLVPRGGATFVRQGIVRAKAFRGSSTLVHDGLRVHAATAVPPPPAPPAPDPTVPAPPA